jgi:hypothetical protein
LLWRVYFGLKMSGRTPKMGEDSVFAVRATASSRRLAAVSVEIAAVGADFKRGRCWLRGDSYPNG